MGLGFREFRESVGFWVEGVWGFDQGETKFVSVLEVGPLRDLHVTCQPNQEYVSVPKPLATQPQSMLNPEPMIRRLGWRVWA